jgi:hypothetical protein
MRLKQLVILSISLFFAQSILAQGTEILVYKNLNESVHLVVYPSQIACRKNFAIHVEFPYGLHNSAEWLLWTLNYKDCNQVLKKIQMATPIGFDCTRSSEFLSICQSGASSQIICEHTVLEPMSEIFDIDIVVDVDDVKLIKSAQSPSLTDRNSIAKKAGQGAVKDAADIKAAETKILVENLVELNSPSYDFSLVYSTNRGDEFIFSSSRKESTGFDTDPVTGEDFFDLFVAGLNKKGRWDSPVPLKLPINTTSHEAAACFNKDFSMMYYTLCKNEKKDRFACDILVAKKSGAGYGDPINLNLIPREQSGDDSSRVGHPALSPDDKYMVFSSNMPGGKGGKDLWYVTYDKMSDSWGKPTNLTALNSAGDEMFPYIAKDGNLYFSSNGRGGFGGLDIFKAEKTGVMTFMAPTVMGYPINSSSDDFGFVLNEVTEVSKFSGYFTSNRPGGKGLDDIYSFMESPL